MTLKVIDISSHNPINEAGNSTADAVIIKATQGTGYVNPNCNGQWDLATKKGKLVGLYHYASGGDPVKEANYFVNNIKNYIGKATLWIDWEKYQNEAQWGNKNWCRQFVDEVYRLTKVWCGVYVQASAINQVANLVNTCPLWVAGYPVNAASWDVPKFIYNISPWKVYTIWQFTSGGGLDRNIANLDKKGWEAIATGDRKKETKPSKPAPKPTPKPKPAAYSISGKSLETLATDTINRKTGDGEARKKLLGKYWDGVQAIVNQRSGVINASQAVNILVSGTRKGLYGDGEPRKKLLGTYWQPVQDVINGKKAAAKPKPSARYYTVKSGDTLSGIGSKLGIAWKTLASKNGIKGPGYVIYPGKKIKY